MYAAKLSKINKKIKLKKENCHRKAYESLCRVHSEVLPELLQFHLQEYLA